jgi:tRNA U38,U39,U40 pseudouridine synthase TruA
VSDVLGDVNGREEKVFRAVYSSGRTVSGVSFAGDVFSMDLEMSG